MASPSDLESAVSEFASRVRNLVVPAPMYFPVVELRDRKSAHYFDWQHSAGVYWFVTGDEVVYVGRALPGTGLRARVSNQCTSFGDPKWDLVIKDDTSTVGVVPLPAQDWYWAAALEAFLIARCAPRINRRSS